MIINISKENLDIMKNTFINYDIIINDIKNNPFWKILLYKKNNEIIGFIYYSEIYERIEINQFEIKKEYRNCGFGNIFLNEFIKRVNKDITLEVNINNIAAIKVYENNGFVKKSIRKGYYKGIDGILMERKKDSI